jgi:glutaredoxin-related protein
LKAFLALRDTDPVFAQVRAEGKIGIPCILQEDGTVSLDWTMYVSQA